MAACLSGIYTTFLQKQEFLLLPSSTPLILLFTKVPKIGTEINAHTEHASSVYLWVIHGICSVAGLSLRQTCGYHQFITELQKVQSVGYAAGMLVPFSKQGKEMWLGASTTSLVNSSLTSPCETTA